MANNLFTIVLDTLHGVNVVSSAPKETLTRLINLLHRFQGGNAVGTNTLSIRSSAVKATGTVTLTTTGGAVNDTVSLNGVALTAKQHFATATCTIVVADTDLDDTVTINGYAFTAKSSETLASGYFNLSSTATVAATSLAACINASTDPLISGIVTATSAAGVVTVRAVATGTGGNSLTFVSSDADGLAVTGSGTLAGATAAAAGEWDMSGSLTQQAASLAAAVNASTNALIQYLMTATSALGVMTVTASIPGKPGNAFTLAKSGSNIAVSGTGRLTGGDATLTTFTFAAP